MDKFEINIGLFGCVSVGKSTLINAITGKQFSDVEMKKTTMVPQVYVEKNDGICDTNMIREINRGVNETIEKVIDQKQFTIDKCRPLYHQIDRICDLFDSDINDSNLKINIYDIPGLNDSASKNIYFEWVKQNIKLFDIIIFMTDINQGLNNSDEIEILNLLMSSVIKHNARMICLMNKCDDIYFDEEENDLIFEEKEQQNIYIQANNLLADIAKNHEIDYNSEYFTPFYPISSENCYIYRVLFNNVGSNVESNPKLDVIHINRLGKNECGANQWKKMDLDQKELMFESIVSDLRNTYESKIRDTGYIAVKDIIQKTIKSNKLAFIQNKINNSLKDLDILDFDDLPSYIKIIATHVKNLECAKKFGYDVSYELFWNKIISAITKYIYTVNALNTNMIKNNRIINLKEFETLHATMQIHCSTLTVIVDALRNIPDYPEKIITGKIDYVIKKMLLMYREILDTVNKDNDYVCPHNILQYLQTISTYARLEFDSYCHSFMNIINKSYMKNISEYPNELQELFDYIVENMTPTPKKNILVVELLISKQEYFKYESCECSIQYFNYLLQLKKFLKKVLKENITLRCSPFDILLEVTNKNVFRCLEHKHGLNRDAVSSLLNDILEKRDELSTNTIYDIESDKKNIQICLKID
jgi:small GTP-binding protein